MPISPPTHNFRLHFAAQNDPAGYVITLQRLSDQICLEEAAQRWPDRSALEQSYLGPLHDSLKHTVTPEFRTELGRQLAALLPASIRVALYAEWLAGPRPAGMRLRLSFSPQCAALSALPWEFLVLDGEASVPDFPAGAFALQSHFHLVRQPEKTVSVSPLPVNPLKILIVCADPGTAAYPPMLHLEAEIAEIERALAAEQGRALVDVQRHVSPGGLESALKRQAPHVLHFIGHGAERPSGGVLALHDGAAGASELYGETLANWLKGASTRLVVLSACHTSAAGFSGQGVAQSLVKAGIHAVVAMQLPMRDSGGPKFAAELYRTLLHTGSIEAAVWNARQGLQGFGADWAVPTLHLSGDTGELFSYPAVSTPVSSRRANIPYLHNPKFVGRESVMQEIQSVLHGTEPVPVALAGMGGMGKTQIAVEYALSHEADYPGGLFWCNAADTSRFMESYAQIGRSYFDLPEPLSAERCLPRVRDALQNLAQPALLILDNLNEETELSHLPALGPCRMLLTTRIGWLARQERHAIPLNELDRESALKMLLSPGKTCSQEEYEAAQDIAAKVGHLPLALALIAHYTGGERLAAYRDKLTTHRIEALEGARGRFMTSTHHNGAIFDAIDLSYQRLDTTAKIVLATASCFANRGIARTLLQEAAEVANFDDAVAMLRDYLLLTEETEERFSLHELVRVFTQEQASLVEWPGIFCRVALGFTRLLEEANARKEWNKARREIAHCRALLNLASRDWAQTPSVQEHLHPLLLQMGEYYFNQGETARSLACREMGLKIVETLYGPDGMRAIPFQMDLAVLLATRDPVRAWKLGRQAYRRIKQTYGSHGPEMPEYLNMMGYILHKQAHLRRAEPFFRRALAVQEATHGVLNGSYATFLSNLGALYEEEGRYAEAQQAFQRALDIDEQVHGKEHVQVAIRLDGAGRLLGFQEKWEEALALHSRGLAINRAAFDNNNINVAASHYYVAEDLHRLERLPEALANYEAALPIIEDFYGPDFAYCQLIRDRIEAIKRALSAPDQHKG